MMKIKRRQQITEWLLRVIEAANKSDQAIDEEKLTAECCLIFYCGERLVKEILKHLKITRKIIEDMNELYLTDYYEKLNQGGSKDESTTSTNARTEGNGS